MLSPPGQPRVLHIGNIGNNAYQNARILNAAGVPSDVLCHSYYHVMGCPEWEDGDIPSLPPGFDEFHPAWRRVHVRDFVRPRWFAQGPFDLAVAYLLARTMGAKLEAHALWGCLEAYRHFGSDRPFRMFRALGATGREVLRWGSRGNLGLGVRRWVRRFFSRRAPVPPSAVDVADLVARFARSFPDRADTLTAADIAPFAPTAMALAPLMFAYDVVIGYSTDGIYPLLAGHPCFLAYEHGTLRAIPFEDSAIGRLTALAYRSAAGAFVTNCDNRVAAERLGLERHRWVPHPMNDRLIGAADGAELRSELVRRHDADFVVLHPSRLHWEAARHPSWEKGNDLFLRGFARFVREVAPRALLVLVRWGKKVAETERLLQEEGIAARVHWIEPVPNRTLLRWIRASDAVADQFWLGTFGGITPKALGCARPVLLNLEPEQHHWCFDELPPVCRVRAPAEAFDALARLYRDRVFAARLAAESRTWYRAHHAEDAVRERLLEVLRDRWGAPNLPVPDQPMGIAQEGSDGPHAVGEIGRVSP